MIIVLEGINGAGKTTQAKMLANRLGREVDNSAVYLYQDPGVSKDHPAHKEIRRLARFGEWENEMTRAMLFMAARCELISKVKEVSNDPNTFIVLDRYVASYYAYQRPAFAANASEPQMLQSFAPSPVPTTTYIAPGQPPQTVQSHLATADARITDLLTACGAFVPYVTIFLPITPELGVQRFMQISKGKTDVFEDGGVQQMAQLADDYEMMFNNGAAYPFLGQHIIKMPMQEPGGEATPDQLHQDIWLKLNELAKIWNVDGFDFAPSVTLE